MTYTSTQADKLDSIVQTEINPNDPICSISRPSKGDFAHLFAKCDTCENGWHKQDSNLQVDSIFV